MKKIYSILCLSILTSAALAQTPDSSAAKVDTSWKKGGFVNVNTSQTGLTNWAAGGQNSVAVGSSLNIFANYKKGKIEWNNSLGLGYAVLQTGSIERKSDDRIDLTTKFGRQTSEHWYLSALANFKSQFAKGFNYPNDSTVISNFLAPAYILVALGYDYMPNDNFSLFLSPATGRLIIVNSTPIADAGTYGNDAAVYAANGTLISHGKKMKSEFGAYVKAAYKKDIMQNVNLLAKVDLFNNYTDTDASKRKNVVVNGELAINLKVNKFIAANIHVITIYDNDVDTDTNAPGVQRRLQVEEVIGAGLSYQF